MKTRLLLIFLLASFSLSINAQNSWSAKANFGGNAREGAAGFFIGSKGYIGTGWDVSTINYKNDFWEWDSSTNVWTQKANFGGVAREDAVGFAIGTKGYIGTGTDGGWADNHQDFWEYDPSSNIWTQKANYVGGLVRSAVGFSIGDKGYVGTGSDNTNALRNDFYEFDPVANSWAQKANFGGTARSEATGFSIGDKGYIGTGYDGADKQDFWEYNQSTDSWIQKANFGGVARYSATGFSIGSFGFIGTGTHSTSYTYYVDFWQYNPSTNSWTQKTNYGTACMNAVGFSSCTKGYIGTGGAGSSTQYQNFMQYAPSITPSAAFTASQTTFNAQTCINFTDVSTNAPTSWSWTFPSGSPASSTVQNPTNICFNTAGTYTITLIASNLNCTSTTTQVITVLPFGTGVIENTNAEIGLNVFPNPSTGKFTIDSKITKGEISIYNLLGEKVFLSTVQQINGSAIDLSYQPNGIYFINVKTERESLTQKIIIEK